MTQNFTPYKTPAFTPAEQSRVQQAFHGTVNSDGHLPSLVGKTITQKAAADSPTSMRVGIGLNWQSASWTTRVGAHLHASSFTHLLTGNTKGRDVFWGLEGQW
ncbi:MAG: hypothetical protein IT497_04905 [Ottowia sp.]|nr:hypothetical protein [Ottowia sp.]